MENAHYGRGLIEAEPSKIIGMRSGLTRVNAMNFSIYRAEGGFVVELRMPPSRSSANKYHDEEPEFTLHIIREDQQLGEEIDKIIHIQLLRS